MYSKQTPEIFSVDEYLRDSDTETCGEDEPESQDCVYCDNTTTIKCDFCDDDICFQHAHSPNIIENAIRYKKMHVRSWEARLSDAGWQRFIEKKTRQFESKKKFLCTDCTDELHEEMEEKAVNEESGIMKSHGK